MKIKDILSSDGLKISYEVFPPKTSDTLSQVMENALEIAELSPSYMSVTYGAGGGTSDFTSDIGAALLRKGVTPLSHLTCVSSDRQRIRSELDKLKSKGIENVLALRGDIPQGYDRDKMTYRYASELIEEIAAYGSFCVGGACYPETHPESPSSDSDIEFLKIKVGSGCSFLTTQMFFDNNILYNFMFRLLKKGVDVPVVPGIMPVTNAVQIKRIVSISQNALPQRFVRIVDRFGHDPEAMKQAGIAYATEQIIDLYANGFNSVHVYSMNKPDVARAIRGNLSGILGK